MHNEWNSKGKEKSPQETVNQIEDILRGLGHETDYIVHESDVDGCYSSSVSFATPGLENISVNGKGSSLEFSKASAYGELMERLQNFFISEYPVARKDKKVTMDSLSFIDMSDYDLLHPAIKHHLDTVADSISMFPELKDTALKKLLNSMKESHTFTHFRLETFWDFRRKDTVSLPVGWLHGVCGSNGMAAGNTIEEAIVQGCCEIIERYVLLEFLNNKIVFPEFPQEVIDEYPYVSELKKQIEAKGNYRVSLYDASLGKGLPVAFGTISNLDTGEMSFQFGCHPSMQIALERVFTETFQGATLDVATTFSCISFAETDMAARINNFNAVKCGVAHVPFDIYCEEPSYEYTGWDQKDATDNALMASKLIRLLDEMSGDTPGAGVYICDTSILGFPTVFIFVPNVSEVRPVDYESLTNFIYCDTISSIFMGNTYPDKKVLSDARAYSAQSVNKYMENTFSRICIVPFSGGYPEVVNEMALFSAICSFDLKEYGIASKFFKSALESERDYGNKDNLPLIRAYSIVSQSMEIGLNKEKIKTILTRLFSKELAGTVIDQLLESDSALLSIYPSCNPNGCEGCTCECNQIPVEDLYYNLFMRREQFINSKSRFFDGEPREWM